MRQLQRKAVGSPLVQDVPVASVIPGNELRRDKPEKAGRPHGIANVDVDPTGRRLLVSSTDSSIYLYNTNSIHLGYERVLTGHSQTSFYIRARFSPDGNFVLSGSADSKGYIWDLRQPTDHGALSPFLELPGHLGGEASAVDWCRADFFKIATCADDSTTRIWTLDSNFDRQEDFGSVSARVVRAQPPEIRPRVQPKAQPLRRSNPAVRTKLYKSQDIRTFFSPSSSPGPDSEMCTQ